MEAHCWGKGERILPFGSLPASRTRYSGFKVHSRVVKKLPEAHGRPVDKLTDWVSLHGRKRVKHELPRNHTLSCSLPVVVGKVPVCSEIQSRSASALNHCGRTFTDRRPFPSLSAVRCLPVNGLRLLVDVLNGRDRSSASTSLIKNKFKIDQVIPILSAMHSDLIQNELSTTIANVNLVRILYELLLGR